MAENEHEIIDAENRGKDESHSFAQIQVSQKFESPIPAPHILEGYEAIYPGAAKIIIDDFKANSKYVREANQKAVEAQIAKEKRGQYMAYSILIGILCIVGISLILGNITFAGVSGLAFLALAAKNSFDENSKKGK